MMKYKDNSKDLIKQLGRAHGGIANASVSTVNKGAKFIEFAYQAELNTFTHRNKFTRGATIKFLSKAKSSKGGFRFVEDINSVVGVRKMKGKNHYLLDQEVGGVTRGNPKTLGKVAMPLDGSRVSNSDKRPVRGAMRLTKAPIQTLSLGGRQFGMSGDGFGVGQRWAILNRIKKDKSFNLKRQFFFEGSRGVGVFVAQGTKFRKVRDLDKNRVAIKPTHKFQKATSRLTQGMMEKTFINEAKRELKRG